MSWTSTGRYYATIGSLLLTATASSIIFLIWISSEIATQGASQLQFAGIEQSKFSISFRQILTGSMILSPSVLFWMYSRSTLLSKYVIRQFVIPFSYCFGGFIAIWLIIDLSDNGPDLSKAGASFSNVIHYYFVQIPQIVVTILPITLLLAILYSLGKMSRTNELISMLISGQSILRILRPLFFIGIYSSMVNLVLNYEWAPEAESHKENVMASFEKVDHESPKNQYSVTARLYRNRENHRSWFIGEIPPNLATAKLHHVEIYQSNKNGDVQLAYFADQAKWDYSTKSWELLNGLTVRFEENTDNIEQKSFEKLLLEGWPETPWKIYSESLIPEQLGIAGLSFHVKTNSDQPPRLLAPFKTQWHYRWALPASCLVITLIATPLGIVYSRHSLTGSAATAMMIFFGMLVLTNLFLALGQGMRVPAFLGAWSTNLIIASIGIILLFLRTKNQELPKPYIASAWKWVRRNIFKCQRKTTSRRASPSNA